MIYQQIPTLNQDRDELLSGQEETDGIASSVHSPKIAKTKTAETGAESSARSSDQSKTASLVTSRDGRSRKRISIKLGQKKWAGLKKRRKSFVLRKKRDKNIRTRKMLPWQKSTDETVGYSKGKNE